jgi:hypothetical protein
MTLNALKARYYEARTKELLEAFFDQLDKLLPWPNGGVSKVGVTMFALAQELRGASAVQRKRMRDHHSRGPRAWEFYLWKLAQKHTDMIGASSPAQSPWPAVRPEVAGELKHGSRKRQPFAEYLGDFSDDIAEIKQFAGPGGSWLSFVPDTDVEHIATGLPLTEENRKRFFISESEMQKLAAPALKRAELILKAREHMLEPHCGCDASNLHVHHEDGSTTCFFGESWLGTGSMLEQVLGGWRIGHRTKRPAGRTAGMR